MNKNSKSGRYHKVSRAIAVAYVKLIHLYKIPSQPYSFKYSSNHRANLRSASALHLSINQKEVLSWGSRPKNFLTGSQYPVARPATG